mmetsp:Transcript_22836/g.64630  ORF Transcript_22836/g.64630 Transcript_22836/m.64630 type:complete len:270 (-) Transcript_22836:1250-2059(-)
MALSSSLSCHRRLVASTNEFNEDDDCVVLHVVAVPLELADSDLVGVAVMISWADAGGFSISGVSSNGDGLNASDGEFSEIPFGFDIVVLVVLLVLVVSAGAATCIDDTGGFPIGVLLSVVSSFAVVVALLRFVVVADWTFLVSSPILLATFLGNDAAILLSVFTSDLNRILLLFVARFLPTAIVAPPRRTSSCCCCDTVSPTTPSPPTTARAASFASRNPHCNAIRFDSFVYCVYTYDNNSISYPYSNSCHCNSISYNTASNAAWIMDS